MANQYHNLGGWLRDLRNVLGDEGYPLADSYYWELRQLLQELLGELGGDDVTDAEDLEPSDGDDDVDLAGPADGADPGTERSGARSRRSNGVRGPARVDELLPRESGQPLSRGVRSDPVRVARAVEPVNGIIRTATRTMPIVLNKPKAAPPVPRGTRKGGKRRGVQSTKKTRK